MAKSGIKADEDSLALAKLMLKNSSIKAIFLRLNEKSDSVIPDFDKDRELSPSEYKEKGVKSCVRDGEVSEHEAHLLSAAAVKGDLMQALKERLTPETAKYVAIRVFAAKEEEGMNTPMNTESIIFATWAPSTCSVKQKLTLSSTKAAARDCLDATLKFKQNSLQFTDLDDVTMQTILDACFMSGTAPDGVVSFDGKEVCGKKGKYKFKQ